MTRLWILTGALSYVAFTSAGWAQSVLVRSGEHADFTRVVFNVEERMEVQLGYGEDGVTLRFDREDLQFDTSTVFDRIPITRLTDISVKETVDTGTTDTGNTDTGTTDIGNTDTGNAVTDTAITSDAAIGDGSMRVDLSLACRCDVETFWDGDRAFVVDISDETALSAALYPSPFASPPDDTGATPAAQSQDGVLTTDQSGAQRANPLVPEFADASLPRDQSTPSVGSVAFLIAEALERQEDLQAAVEPQSDPDLTEYANRVRASQDAILQEIGRAATQGLLDPRSDATRLPETVAPSQPVAFNVTGSMRDTQGADSMASGRQDATRQDALPDPDSNITLRAQTSLDEALSDRMNLAVAGQDSGGCLNASRVNTLDWAGDGSFVDQIGGLRSGILGEFDQPSDAEIKKLARFYIHFGFGAEAAQVIGLLSPEARVDPVLPALINILEYGHDGAGSALAGFMDCEPRVAVWSLLSYQDVPGNQPIDPDGIVRGLMKFPVHLRAYLGPTVGERLRVAGYTRAADHVARALLRNEKTQSTEAAFLNAQSPRAADGDLSAVVADNGQPSADALLQLIDRRLDAREAVSEDMALLAGAYAMEHRDVPMGQDLSRAYVLALAAADDFDQAFSEYARQTQSGPVPRDGTLSDLFDILARSSEDATFLNHTINAAPSVRFNLEDAIGNDVATRLLNLGFPDAAAAYVAPMARGPMERTRKLLRAEIALTNGRPRQAELELLGETGEDVLQILARARSLAGEHSEAQAMYSQIDAQESALREAWLDGDWDTLQAHSDPAIAAVAARQTKPSRAQDVPATQVLARNTAMIEDSQSMRSEIEALLSGLTVPDAPRDEAASPQTTQQP